jgi:Ion channel
VGVFGHLRRFFGPNPPHPHLVLRRRIVQALLLVGAIDVIGTVLMWMFENDAARSEISNLWDAFFFTTVQLLTVSSQMRNPVTTGGRIVDIFLELTALCLVSGIAGAFASFFLDLGKNGDSPVSESPTDG